jgi:hypothetical protein
VNIKDSLTGSIRDMLPLEDQEWKSEDVVGMPMGEEQMLDFSG